jgi:hypothetical protein
VKVARESQKDKSRGTLKSTEWLQSDGLYKGNLPDLRRILHLSLAKGNPK